MQTTCTSLQTDNHTSTSPLSFLQAGCPSCRPTNSVKALKANSAFHPFGVDKLVSCNWMSAASVAVGVTSGECHEGKAGMVLFAGKTV